ncbi:GNAT family N-acetyltransferase [Enterobacter hormaechei]|uniref:GNAT family N-acetyltransferase n=1 Tax=Enterobacter hormaechei TaxID=158836 RepID=UPI001371879C|nr:GNAT family N-acetyltransferase [Enterobacter hormaechei]MZJ51785.1 GNAT family N-acetyltransferase [Enterobacter hormaechei]MZJ71860.1 GNAT family N-acetyltransferase [Enterobacter hormaechei]MZK01180.1 GNAT family N-acetyltransferase [Enterobacter hormaechei]MZK12593.1 GNAT family N-acetyltransferase [Enterobacter hormaechei]MZK19981.1 GNAT family N-acetyltransferase [Enterobacter hormaechei]
MATITTTRLHLTPFEPSDWTFFRSLREDPNIMRYMAAIMPEKETRRLFAARLMAEHVFVIRLYNDVTPLGDIGLQISAANREEADIGYTVVPDAQGKGIASEALRAVCEYAFNQTGVKAINAYVLADNVGSVRVLEKAGFVRTQVLEKAYEINGVRYDDWVYRLECGAV